jgi:polysaccharide export outer membrane protein
MPFNGAKMNWKLAHCLLAISSLPLLAQTGGPSADPPRDARGFLTPPVAGVDHTPLLASPETAPAGPPSPAAVASSLAGDSNTPAAMPSATVANYVLDDKHLLLPGDRVSFQIVEDRTNAISLLVAESAELDIPYLGRMSVKGKTCKQLADEIKQALEKDYYHRATVIIGLDALSRVLGRVYIFGPVRTPGAVEIPANENFTAGKAIMKAGGFGDFANPKKVQIIRKTDTGNKTFTVNLVNVLKKGMTEEDVTLEPDDFIIVPESKINFGW